MGFARHCGPPGGIGTRLLRAEDSRHRGRREPDIRALHERRHRLQRDPPREALDEWTATRLMLIGYVRTLDERQRTELAGHHEQYGRVTVERYLEIALKHDRDHLRGLERLAGQLTR